MVAIYLGFIRRLFCVFWKKDLGAFFYSYDYE